MSWKYDQSTGDLHDPSGGFVGTGYSGAGRTLEEGRNNPAMEADPGKGPIPAGLWSIGAPVDHPDTIGPYAMPLTPVGHDAHGRSAFFIHGNNKTDNASHGCVILAPAMRHAIWNSGDHTLEVTP